jgi:hypothetical protein
VLEKKAPEPITKLTPFNAFVDGKRAAAMVEDPKMSKGELRKVSVSNARAHQLARQRTAYKCAET